MSFVDRVADLLEGRGSSDHIVSWVEEEVSLPLQGLEYVADVQYECSVSWATDPGDGSVYDIEPYDVKVLNLGTVEGGRLVPKVWGPNEWEQLSPEKVPALQQAAGEAFNSEMPGFTRAVLKVVAGGVSPGNEVGNRW